MKRYLIASLAAGVVYALLGMVFAHFVLDEKLANELVSVFGRMKGDVPATPEVAAESDWGEFAMHIVLRLLFGFVTMAVFAALARKRPRLRAARIAGVSFWVVAYIAMPVLLMAKYGMSVTLLCVMIGYGLVETQVAANTGALLWGKPPPKA